MHILLSALFGISASAVMATAPGPAEVARALAGYDCISGTVRYEVSLPSSSDPVVYSIDLHSTPAPGDTLAQCQYLIDWRLPRPHGESHGFAAYADGNHFRYRDNKLQEYHVTNDPIPFHTGAGVQNQAQFAELLPPYMSVTIGRMATDSTYILTVRESGENLIISGTQRIKGFDANEFEYIFDGKTLLPVSMDITYNPASISEQIVTAYFTWNTETQCKDVTEESLIALYPEVFEKFRTSNFRVENLKGTDLPEFTGRMPDGQRYVHHRADPLARPTLLVFIDPSVESASATVADVREAAETSAVIFDIIFAVSDTDPEVIQQLFGNTEGGDEIILTGVRSLARDCGVTAYPTLIFTDKYAKVQDIVTAYNKELPTVVIQKITLCNS